MSDQKEVSEEAKKAAKAIHTGKFFTLDYERSEEVIQLAIDASVAQARNEGLDLAIKELEDEMAMYEPFEECWKTVKDCKDRIASLKSEPK